MCVCAGVLDATQETKISQVRAAALETLSTLLDAIDSGRMWPLELQERVRGRLQDAVATEKASVIRAQAAAVLKLVAGQPSNASQEAPGAADSAPQSEFASGKAAPSVVGLQGVARICNMFYAIQFSRGRATGAMLHMHTLHATL